jgi:hypothetical protein
MRRAAPFRFLGLLLGGWVGIRAALLSLGGGAQALPAGPAALAARTAPGMTPTPPVRTAAVATTPARSGFPENRPAPFARPFARERLLPVVAGAGAAAVARAAMPGDAAVMAGPPPATAIGPAAATAVPRRPGPGRWSGSAWLLARGEGGRPSLAPGGTLGGSQAGGRLLYRLGRSWSLSARAYLPLRRPAGAEVAAGLDWRPFASIPVSLLAERRQAIGEEGRSAFSITAYGGFSRALGRRFRIDGYAQAGLVGLRSRDAFADGSLRAVAALGRFEPGVGAWGAAQPGAARLDVGPSLSYRLPARAAVRIEADWRFRVAGDALPGSGPALVLAADF